MKKNPKKQTKFDGQEKVPMLCGLKKVDEKSLKFAIFIFFPTVVCVQILI
jgi:hypothetical protein